MTEKLTPKQCHALESALSDVGLRLEAAFGWCAVVIVAQPMQSHVVGVVSNLPPSIAVQVLQNAVKQTAVNIEDRMVSMKPLTALDDPAKRRLIKLRSPRIVRKSEKD